MSKETEYQKLTREDLDKLAGEPLPEKAAMSLINANIAIPTAATQNRFISVPSQRDGTRSIPAARLYTSVRERSVTAEGRATRL